MSNDEPGLLPFEDPWLREGKPSPIEWEQRLYVQTRNPLHVWRAFEICRESMGAVKREARDPFPPWILEYFDRVVEHLHAVFGDPPTKNKAAAIAEAFEMKGGTVFEDWANHRKRLLLGGRVSQALADGYQRKGYTLANAVKDVAKEQGVSPAEARQAYEMYVKSEALRVQSSSKGSGSIQ